jgi:DNA-directed RNA polymerase specialized sigma24 family protein
MALDAALASLPLLWRRVVIVHDVMGQADRQVAGDLGLALGQVRDILACTRAAVRSQIDRTHTGGPW